MKQYFKHPTDPAWINQRECLRRNGGWAAVGRFFHLCEMYACSFNLEHIELNFSAETFASRLHCHKQSLYNFFAIIVACELATVEYSEKDDHVSVIMDFMAGRCSAYTHPGERFFPHPANFLSSSAGARLFRKYKFDGVGRFFALCESLAITNEECPSIPLSVLKKQVGLRGQKAVRFFEDLSGFGLATGVDFDVERDEVKIAIDIVAPPKQKTGKKVESPEAKDPAAVKREHLPDAGQDPVWDRIVAKIPRREKDHVDNLLSLYVVYQEEGGPQKVHDAVEYTRRQNVDYFMKYCFHAMLNGYAKSEMDKERIEVYKKSQFYVDDYNCLVDFCARNNVSVEDSLTYLKNNHIIGSGTYDNIMDMHQDSPF